MIKINKKIQIHLNDKYICPENLYKSSKIAFYYLYKAPNIKCRYSSGSLDESTQKEVFSYFLKLNNINKSNYKMLKYIRNTSLKNMNINGNTIDIKDNRMICSLAKESEKYETEYESLIRHIRNAFAHGNICMHNKKLILTDLKPKDKNSTENIINARMIINKQSLVDFKNLLEAKIKSISK